MCVPLKQALGVSLSLSLVAVTLLNSGISDTSSDLSSVCCCLSSCHGRHTGFTGHILSVHLSGVLIKSHHTFTLQKCKHDTIAINVVLVFIDILKFI